MRIGILTYHCVPNFGAQLQAMSTIGYLKKMGHTPVLLHWYPKDLEQQYARRVSKVQRNCQMQFAESFFPLSALCRNEKQLIKEIERQQLDMIITGSDALFRYVPKCDRKKSFSKRRLRFVNNFVSCEDLYGNPFFCDYYGELSRQIPVVAFSVSSQSCPYFRMNQEERDIMGQYLRNFSKITVRDQWTKSMVEEIAGLKHIAITPDPVFAFNQNCNIVIPSKEDICARFSLPEHYVLFSFSQGLLEKDYVQGIANVLKQKGLAPVGLPEPEGLGNYGLEKSIDMPLNPIDWYALIKNSDGYVGTRMHPIIVCLHNAVPFFSFDGNGTIDAVSGMFNQKSSKIYDILKKASLEDYTYPLQGRSTIPSKERVVGYLLSFNRTRCVCFAENMYKNYISVLSGLLV
ncbi:MAG: polysaccharide pyruvyl transferase family protein [Prevotella sp.]|nr:polysaccharide pyruvyl transferase family protein [Prevotella sp.]